MGLNQNWSFFLHMGGLPSFPCCVPLLVLVMACCLPNQRRARRILFMECMLLSFLLPGPLVSCRSACLSHDVLSVRFEAAGVLRVYTYPTTLSRTAVWLTCHVPCMPARLCCRAHLLPPASLDMELLDDWHYLHGVFMALRMLAHATPAIDGLCASLRCRGWSSDAKMHRKGMSPG